jgi:hypothetical protein
MIGPEGNVAGEVDRLDHSGKGLEELAKLIKSPAKVGDAESP